MNEITRVGVDLAKSVIKVHGVDAAGKVVTNRQLPRDKFMAWCVQLPPGCPIAMEASSGAHHWARKLAGFGLEPRCAVCIWVRAGDKPVQKHRLQMCSLILVLPQLQVTQMQEYRSSRKKCKYRYPMLDYLGSPCRGGLEANLFIISGSFEIQPLPNGLTRQHLYRLHKSCKSET